MAAEAVGILASLEFQVSILLFVALAGYLLASRINQSAVVGIILAGIAVGPSWLNLVTYTDFVSSLAHLGAVVLLFTVGLHFKIKDIVMIMKTLKQTDLTLLKCLRRNSRAQLTQISKEIKMPITTIFQKIRKLQPYIIKNTTLFDFSKVSFPLSIMFIVKIEQDKRGKNPPGKGTQ